MFKKIKEKIARKIIYSLPKESKTIIFQINGENIVHEITNVVACYYTDNSNIKIEPHHAAFVIKYKI